MAKKILLKKINNLINQLAVLSKADNMPIKEAYIFGSHALGRAKKNSDLDLCFVSPGFKNDILAEAYLRTKIYFINQLKMPVDIVAYHSDRFKPRENFFVAEIKRTGIKVI